MKGTGWGARYWKERGRQLSTNYIARSCFCPLEMFRGTCSTTYPVPWKRIAARNFRNQPNNRAPLQKRRGFNNVESEISRADFPSTREWIARFCTQTKRHDIYEKNSYRIVFLYFEFNLFITNKRRFYFDLSGNQPFKCVPQIYRNLI